MVAEKFSEDKYTHCFLVDIEMKGSKLLRVFIDSVEGVSFGECKALSRFLEEKIELDSLMDSNYLLEVSSPGVDRPLKYLKQYSKHQGRLFELETEEGIITGLLKEVLGEKLVFEKKDITKNKKKAKEAENNLFEINFESIKTARVLVSF